MKKLTYSYIKSEFEKRNYELLSDVYKNSSAKLKYRCPKGHIHSISWDNFKAGKRCPYCSGTGKPTIEFVKMFFEQRSCTLLTKKYKNNSQKLKYVCPNNHTHLIRWNHFSRGHGCRYCAGKTELTIDYVRPYFEKENYTLLSINCKNSQQKLYYICPHGHKNSMNWNNWQQGKRCPVCSYIKQGLKISGINHPNWKGGISCEPYCQDWTKEYKESIKERDGYKCLNPDCWKTSDRLSVHHIDYNKKNCKSNNLITLCISCNARANRDRGWHTAWYLIILQKRYGEDYIYVK